MRQRRSIMRLFVWIIVISVAAPAAHARVVALWPYDRLFKEADVIVIAAAIQTVDTDAHPAYRDWMPYLVGQRTTFTIDCVVKGTPPDGPLALNHFRFKDGGPVPPNAPMLVVFRTKPMVIRGDGKTTADMPVGTPRYLLFLKRNTDGSLEPIAGEVDPALSVKEIYPPLPSEIEKKQP
jgi:hypothetical protein